jgi:hypothetical protein
MSMGAGPFRSCCPSPSFSVMITKKRSMPLGEIQGPVCVSITLRSGMTPILEPSQTRSSEAKGQERTSKSALFAEKKNAKHAARGNSICDLIELPCDVEDLPPTASSLISSSLSAPPQTEMFKLPVGPRCLASSFRIDIIKDIS